MFDVSIEFMKDFINLIPLMVAIILVFNICSSLLWGGK